MEKWRTSYKKGGTLLFFDKIVNFFLWNTCILYSFAV